ncbi:MAG: peptidylprolyl isomerase [Bacteroidales bacterium]|nr:peptidylprolyl isomerase [Candidatus Sodaliphilus limicaballi]
MKHKLLLSTVLVGSVLLATAAKDPVLMKINGKDVKLSEFEYLYNKNSKQQVEKETLDQYVDRFITYKLKVTDAEAAKLDTLPSFKKELDGYRDEMVRPFLEDTTVKERLVREAYERFTKNVDVDHLMLSLGKDYADNKKQLALADSLRTVLKNGAVWDSVAAKYTIDPSFARNSGHYGFIRAGQFPYSFEYGVYNTPVGEISQPIRTDFGIHLVRVNAIRDDEGTVRARHILRLFPRTHKPTDEEKQAVKQKIDSIFELVKAGGNFEELAKQYSEDPGSAKRGGDLGFFSRGQMVPQFDKVSFTLKNGEISEPFETSYGYHIVQRLENKGFMPLEEARPRIEKAISMDERAKMPQMVKLAEAKKQYNYQVNPKLEKHIEDAIKANGGYDSTLVATLRSDNFPAFTYANEATPVSVIAAKLNPKTKLNDESAKGYFMSLIGDIADAQVMKYYTDNLINDNTEFRNLLNEYRDGMLLFEISNRKVWEGAGKDTTGLKNYFEQNRAKYTWSEPHFKGIILSAKGDSILDAVKADILKVGHVDSLPTYLHKKYSNSIKMERMVVVKGENQLADFLCFNGPAIPETAKYNRAIILEGGLINAPEVYTDVKGQLTSDYQDVLEKQWVEELKAKYPVVVDKRVLKKLR